MQRAADAYEQRFAEGTRASLPGEQREIGILPSERTRPFEGKSKRRSNGRSIRRLRRLATRDPRRAISSRPESHKPLGERPRGPRSVLAFPAFPRRDRVSLML